MGNGISVPVENMKVIKSTMLFLVVFSLCFVSCAKDDDSGESNSTPLIGKKFYSSIKDGYEMIEFTSNYSFQYYKTDINFIPDGIKWPGTYSYDASTKTIEYKDFFFNEIVGFSTKQTKFLKGKYTGDHVTAEYIYKWKSSETWSEPEYMIIFYAKP